MWTECAGGSDATHKRVACVSFRVRDSVAAMKPTLLFLTLVLTMLTACSSLDSRTRKLQLGMSREQVVKLLGSDYTVAGARKEADGSAIEILRFGDKGAEQVFAYFRNGQLVQWGDQKLLENAPPGK